MGGLRRSVRYVLLLLFLTSHPLLPLRSLGPETWHDLGWVVLSPPLRHPGGLRAWVGNHSLLFWVCVRRPDGCSDPVLPGEDVRGFSIFLPLRSNGLLFLGFSEIFNLNQSCDIGNNERKII